MPIYNDTRHKVFISYYHYDDQWYKNRFEELFGNVLINKSVMDGDINTDLSTDYIKRLIQSGYLTDTSVLAVLVGPNTWKRKHVDWEISAALSKKVGGYSGLVGILLPEFPLSNNRYNYDDLPPRLADNVKSGYAEIYTWNDACSSSTTIKSIIETAFNNRVNKAHLIDNTRTQYVNNRG
ncbi:protein of unknown function DUF1863 [Ruminiclostridium papyrosolvens DSM 2782]|uniref:Thoeris protein ThsB TIR-like domain-containing protein n=1 Tax=Ruminiclostridium papyrosolvens DSM 2782 TaxID=588581 RepID=F1THG2_9FIRM|nr:TIR domain-containing protein [Ruminiclostridium papyrosolvens]EGD46165.1 protein of unknown function DUF1863 [Ruminiclostridium papyrosolvens DSM 2782]WES35945.1 TIR domain-containing protein [Ruminiclostridium papyrosolvens DSM 2782]